MPKKNTNEQVPKQPPEPNPALKRLAKLVGTWDLKGRTPGSKENNVTGWNTFEWMLGGFFLKSSGEITFWDLRIQSVEIIAYDAATETFPSRVYTSMSGVVLPYVWDVRGSQVTHWMDTAKYTGIFSDDGKTLTGGWRPIEGRAGSENVAWDAVMTRVD
jgi:Protein of unknown function (DUF1579)